MAGIGFRLQAMVEEGSYTQATKAYVSAAIMTAGPWLSGVAALAALGGTSALFLSATERTLLFATIFTVLVASMLVASGPQLLLTRYVADRLYLDDRASIAPTCAGVLCMVLPFAFVTVPFVCLAPFSIEYRLLVATLFLVLALIWLVTVFLSAAQEYGRIVIILAISYAIGIGLSLLLGHAYGLLGCLGGFTFGQVLCLSLLTMSIYHEFSFPQHVSLAYLSYIRKYADLLLIGSFYTLGLLVDSLLFWASPQSQVIHGMYHLFAPYDTSKFLAALSTIPVAVIFIIHVETNFYRHYRRYYQLIQAQGTLVELADAREGMVRSARAGIGLLLKIQCFVALFLCLVAQDIAKFIGLAPVWVPLLRMDIVASVGQFLVFIIMLLLLYIDQRRTAAIVVGVFALGNIVLTLLSLSLGASTYGTGYLLASIGAAIVGWFLLQNRLKQLDYLTFMVQPKGS